MPEIKYDWIAIKKDFFESEFMDVYGFLKQVFGEKKAKSGAFTKHAAGWGEEKKKMREEAMKAANEKAKKNLEERYVPNMEQLNKIHKSLIDMVQAAMFHEQQKCLHIDKNGELQVIETPDMFVLEKIWKIVKTEKNESTNNSSLIQAPTLSEDTMAELREVWKRQGIEPK